ncbi:hypothetical protein K7432_006903 [Basidiobolus ranarum]|uniref:Uncharacterized protein n=1 Tax=Basidiobolus ranarum TaxID=34480 RepID=A0ABR2W0W1_9FUNG
MISQPQANITTLKTITLFGESVNFRTTLGTSIIPFVRSTRDKLMTAVTEEFLVIIGMTLVAALVASPREFLLLFVLAAVTSVVPNVRDLVVIVVLAATTAIISTTKEFFIVFSFSVITATMTSTPTFLGIFLIASTIASFLGVQDTIIIFTVSSIAVAVTGVKEFLLLFGITGVFAAITGTKEFLMILFITIAIASLMMFVRGIIFVTLYIFNTLTKTVNRLFTSESPSLFVLLFTLSMVGFQAANRIFMTLIATEEPFIIALMLCSLVICIIVIVRAKLLLFLTAVTATHLLKIPIV